MREIMAKKPEPNQFEKSLAELEEIVAKMETGDLSLEESLSAFEKGIKLTKECQKALDSAEQKVNKLIELNAELQECSPDDFCYYYKHYICSQNTMLIFLFRN